MLVDDDGISLPEVTCAAEGATYAACFLDAVSRYGERPAVRWKDAGVWSEISFSELQQRVFAIAAAFDARGISFGDRVAIWVENSWQWIVCDLACQLLGAVTTTVYHTLVPSQTVALLRDAEVGALLANGERLDGLASTTDFDVASVLCVSIDGGDNGVAFETLLEEGDHRLRTEPQIDRRLRSPQAQHGDLSALFYTSGTTGEPKGVMLTHANVVFNAQRTIAQMLPGGGQTALLHLPLGHVMARNTTVPATLLSGSVVAIAEPQRERIPGNLVESSPTAFPTVPHLLDKFRERALEAIEAKSPVMRRLARFALDHCRKQRLAAIADGGEVRFARLSPVAKLLDRIVLQKIRAKLGGRMEFLVTGGANSNRESVEFFWGLGVPVYEGYGATELTGTAAITWSRAFKFGTVGKIVPGVELKLADDGEVLVRGPIVMKGYWRRPRATSEVIDSEGWYHTGDVGSVDESGYLTIVDRKREMLVLSTGKNVAPQAIENLLKRSQLISNVCAIGHCQRFTTALVVPELAVIGKRLGLTELPDAGDQSVARLLRDELAGLMAELSSFERVKRFALVDESFTPENRLVTPTLKLLRRNIAERFAPEIEDLYADSPKRAIDV